MRIYHQSCQRGVPTSVCGKTVQFFQLFSAEFELEVEVVALGIFPYCMTYPFPFPLPLHLHCLCLRNCIKCAPKKGWRRGWGERGDGAKSESALCAYFHDCLHRQRQRTYVFPSSMPGSQSKFSYLIYSKNWLRARWARGRGCRERSCSGK